MNKEQWIARCAARYQERENLTPEQAKSAAEANLKAEIDSDLSFEFSEEIGFRPEDYADEDIACWMDNVE